MASGSVTSSKSINFYEHIAHFPPVINGRINLVQFLEASSDLVAIVDRIGGILVPIKYDIQGNIDKIKKCYKYDETSCLLELMLDEIRKGKNTAAEGTLWLNRAFLFFEIVLEEIITYLQSDNYDDVNMVKIFSVAYEGSVKKYHNWITQQIFAVFAKMSPSVLQLMRSLDVDDKKAFETKMNNFKVTLHLIRCKLDDFFNDNNIFAKNK